MWINLFTKVFEHIFIEHLLCARHFSELLVYLSDQNEDLSTIRAYILGKNADNKHECYK